MDERYDYQQQQEEEQRRQEEEREWAKQWRDAWTRWARTELGSKTTNESNERSNA